jgi:hypothetical protein
VELIRKEFLDISVVHDKGERHDHWQYLYMMEKV